MKAADIMTPSPITLPPSAPMSDAVRVIDDAGVRHLPIAEGGRAVAILSDRDLREWSVAVLCAKDRGTALDRLAQPIGAVANHAVVAVTPETSIEHVIELLMKEHVSAVVVNDADGKLVGVVSTTDLLRAMRDLV